MWQRQWLFLATSNIQVSGLPAHLPSCDKNNIYVHIPFFNVSFDTQRITLMEINTKVFAFLLCISGSIMVHAIFCKIMTTMQSQKILEGLLKDRKFANWTIPVYPGKQVVVQVSLTFIDMVPLDFFYNHIFAEIVVHQEWKDERLKFNSSLPNATVILTGDSVNDIWLPDLWILNERSVPLNRFPASASTVQLSSEGYVHYTARFSIYVFCPMNYTYFPFDRQTCALPIESYTYNKQIMRLMPTNDVPVVVFNDGFRINEFMLNQSEAVEIHTSEVDYGLTGIFDRVEIRLSLRRHIYYYLVEYYLPLTLVVATSWISFWIDYQCVSARATLPVTTLLTLTSMAETFRAKDAGSLSHSTALEIYISVCSFYVIATLIEYAIILAADQSLKVTTKKFSQQSEQDNANNHSKQENKDTVTESTSNEESLQLDIANDVADDKNSHRSISIGSNEKRAKFGYKISSSEEIEVAFQEGFVLPTNLDNSIFDEYSKVLFPTSFILFNVCYAVVCILAQ